MFWTSQKKFFYGIYLLTEAGILAGRVEQGYAQGKIEAKYGNRMESPESIWRTELLR